MTNWQNVAEENKEEIMAEVISAARAIDKARARRQFTHVEVHLFPGGAVDVVWDEKPCALRLGNGQTSEAIWYDDSGFAGTPKKQLWDEVLANVKKLDREQASI